MIVPNFRKASLRSNPPHAVLGAKKAAYPMEMSALGKTMSIRIRHGGETEYELTLH